MVSLGLDASFVLRLILSCGILINPDLGATSFALGVTANDSFVILEEYTLFWKQALYAVAPIFLDIAISAV